MYRSFRKHRSGHPTYSKPPASKQGKFASFPADQFIAPLGGVASKSFSAPDVQPDELALSEHLARQFVRVRRSAGSCTGGSTSGRRLPGGLSGAGSDGWPGVAGGIIGGSIAPATPADLSLRRLIFAPAAGLACTKDRSDFLTDSSAKQIMQRVNRLQTGHAASGSVAAEWESRDGHHVDDQW